MKKKIYFIVIVCSLGIRLGIPQNTQRPLFKNGRNDLQKAPFRNLFFYKPFSMPTTNPDTVQFIFYAKIANDLLQFVLQDTLYFAKYELTLVIRNSQGESMAEEIKRGKISAETYAETNARNRFTREKLDFFLTPGEYDLFIELLDLESKNPLRQKEKIVLPNFFSKPFTATDLLFFKSQYEDSIIQKETFPYFPPVRSLSDSSFKAKFYICSDGSPHRIHLNRTILNNDEQPVFTDSSDINLNSQIQRVDLHLDQELTFGQYTLSVELTDGKTKTVLKSPLYIQWQSHSVFLPPLEQAIEVLRYVMDSDQWEKIRELPQNEQEQTLEQFWKERDPDPSTKVNELEEEYYQRVAFANHNFSSFQGGVDGWRTDRGRVYIIYGPPSDIERPPTSTGVQSSYEIWYYRNTQRRFVFLDKFGTGDYVLLSEE